MNQIVCPFCGKELLGYSEKHADYTFKQHCLSKHPDRVKVDYNE